jgi:hypothetical protein
VLLGVPPRAKSSVVLAAGATSVGIARVATAAEAATRSDLKETMAFGSEGV